MKDLINRQAAIDKAIMIPVARIVTEDKVIWRKAVFIEDIESLPSVDAVPVIRCKDCKHLQKWRSEESAKRFGQIYECARNVFDCPKPEDFCSHAERKE